MKESKRDDNMAKKDKSEKKVVNKQSKKPIHKYSLNELADMFGVSVTTMRSMYKIRGLDKNEMLSYEEAHKKFSNIV